MGDFVFVLVAQCLAEGLDHSLFPLIVQVGPFAFDDDQGDAVDKEHNVGAAGAVAAALLDDKFVGNVIDVVLGMVPVDIVEAKALAVAVDGLGEAGAQCEQFVEASIGEHETLERFIDQPGDGFVKVAIAKGVRFAFEADLVVLAQPGFEYAGEDDIFLTAAAQRQRLGGGEIVPAEIDQQLQRGNLRADLFEIGVRLGHGATPGVSYGYL